MSKNHPPYPAEFRQQMVDLVLKAGKAPKVLAQEFGCCEKSILHWVARSQSANQSSPSGPKGLTAIEHEELVRLRRENRQLKLERDILAKATAWFAAKGEKTFTPSSD